MIKTTQSLDSLNLPLQGERLIEASAGTGKTFTISTLYLRFLLKLGGSSAFSRPLNVENLLVVTFTEIATTELRDRIRSDIHELRIACLRQSSNNPLFKRFLEEITDKQYAAQCLLLAERQMDEAAIFTIHGFCRRMLNLHSFESGILYEQQLIEDESELRKQACEDFWRRYCYPLSRDIAEAVYSKWKGPKALLSSIEDYLQGEAPIIKSPPSENETLLSRHENIVCRIVKMKQKWLESIFQINNIIEISDIDRCKFNRGNQAKWIEKINVWAEEETRNYHVPIVLKKFSQRFLAEKTKPNGNIPKHPVFIAIDEFFSKPLTIDDLLLTRAIIEIRETITREKHQRGLIGCDDMLSRLEKALSSEKGVVLAEAIRSRFPVAMIDEFQDTDQQQYRIFRYIWHQQPDIALLLIGDPKQAIYSFRRADIFTYMKARREVKEHYTLDTNWRSAPHMVSSVNKLFSQMDPVFMFSEIPFLPIKSAEKNADLRFEWKGEIQPAIRFWLMDTEGCSIEDYQTFMATQAAAQIRDWLNAGERGEALLWRSKISHPIMASDITVLVRNRKEARLVSNALNLLKISSVYLSNRDSVFNTVEAKEILWFLEAALSPEKERTLRIFLSSSILGLTTRDIDFFNNDQSAWDTLVEEFFNYRECWKKYGVMAMLRNLIFHRQIAENMLVTTGGDRSLTNVLHIGELLQEASSRLEGEGSLVRWLTQQISNPSNNSINHQIRLGTDKHLVQIVTIHKSKGLEYPLVCLPFIANYRSKNHAFYHDPISFEPILDLNQNQESIALANSERLAEDLRLLYVALTRSIWHCSLGIAPLFRRRGKKTGKTDFHHSAIGHLIQKGEPKDADGLRLALSTLCNKHLEVYVPSSPDNSPWKTLDSISSMLEAKEIRRPIIDDWRVISYSWIKKHTNSITQDLCNTQDLSPKFDIDGLESKKIIEQQTLTPHQFPRGTLPGIFLHGLFENLDFTKPISSNWVLEMLEKEGYEQHWQPVLTEWIKGILQAPLTNNGISLNQLSPREKQVEMEFIFPINGHLIASTLDKLARKYDPLTKICPPINFQQISGMLNGFIDLIFRYDGRYYLLDYKSNWLGENNEAYTKKSITLSMCSYRYDLQYQFYTLAMHRYLRQRILNYRYETHFGEVIYLFLRGVDAKHIHSGIFTIRPEQELIEEMDRLFLNSTVKKT